MTTFPRTLAPDALVPLGTAVEQVRGRLDQLAGVVDLGQRAADAGEGAVAAVKSLRVDLVDLLGASNRANEQTATRLTEVVQSATELLVARLDRLTSVIERQR